MGSTLRASTRLTSTRSAGMVVDKVAVIVKLCRRLHDFEGTDLGNDIVTFLAGFEARDAQMSAKTTSELGPNPKKVPVCTTNLHIFAITSSLWRTITSSGMPSQISSVWDAAKLGRMAFNERGRGF